MLLLFLYPGITPLQSSPAQRAAGPAPLRPPGLGPSRWCRAAAMVPSPAQDPPPGQGGWVPGGQGGGHHRQSPEGLHYRRCCARQSASPRPTAGQVPRRFRRGQASKRLHRGQAGNFCAPLGLYTFNSAAAKLSRNRFPTQRGGFCTPGTGGAINVSTAAESAAQADTAANPPRFPQRQRTQPQRMDL
jgi:hypothetical protein